jgi:hypothetical protein
LVRRYEHFGETCHINLQDRTNDPRGETHKQYTGQRDARTKPTRTDVLKKQFFSQREKGRMQKRGRGEKRMEEK